ncbi:MAG: hypothetical protein ACHBN1_05685 [Heteroscytonema crispum UTEX LB 1556]
MGRWGDGEMGVGDKEEKLTTRLPTTNHQPPTTNPRGVHQSPGSGNPTKAAPSALTTNS